MGKFDIMSGNEVNLDAQREFVTVRDLIDALGEKFSHEIPVYLSINKSMCLKLSRPKLLDMDSCVKVVADNQRISDLAIGIMRDDCTLKGCLDLPIHIILHNKDRLVKSFKIGIGKSRTMWIDLLID